MKQSTCEKRQNELLQDISQKVSDTQNSIFKRNTNVRNKRTNL